MLLHLIALDNTNAKPPPPSGAGTPVYPENRRACAPLPRALSYPQPTSPAHSSSKSNQPVNLGITLPVKLKYAFAPKHRLFIARFKGELIRATMVVRI